MKTTTQELIEEIQYWKEKAPVGSAFKDCLIILEGSAINKLEKEKEQIIDACNANLKGLLTTGKDYYDLNFNHHIEVQSNSYTNFTPDNANAVAEYNNSLTNFSQPKQTNKMETPLQNLKHYFRNDETITKRELERAIDELFDNERSFFIEAFNKGVASTGVISIGLNKGLEEYNSLYKTNNL